MTSSTSLLSTENLFFDPIAKRCTVCGRSVKKCRKKLEFNVNIACSSDYYEKWDWTKFESDTLYYLFDEANLQQFDVPLIMEFVININYIVSSETSKNKCKFSGNYGMTNF